MNYYRKPINKVIDDVKLKMQLGALTLKLSENNNKIDDLIGVDKNIKKDISSNTLKIDNDKNDILTNSGQINTNEGDISSNSSKLNNMDIGVKKDIYKKIFNINNFETTSNYKLIFEKRIDFKFTKTGVIKIKANYEYLQLNNSRHTHIYLFKNNNTSFNEKHINHYSNIVNDEFSIPAIECENVDLIIFVVNPFNNNSKITLNKNNIEFIYNDFTKIPKTDYNLEKITTNENSISSNSEKINTNEGNISSNTGNISTNEGNISSNLEKINDNSSDIASNLSKINTKTSSIYDNSGLISTNTGSIASNLLKINKNTDNITALQTSNIKAFYNLDKIFIYDIKKGNQTVDKNNHYHIFEKEIIYNFVKDSYLEIILKVLTEISNYVLIGFFQILCNFYDENDDLFYTISLSTAMGSINKLSTVKSVFIVPINKNMTKIKIDFFIAPKETQQNRSAKFIIQDINSNKIYIKYFQKTDEMSIKDIQDSLDTVNNTSNDLEKINNSIKLKNIKNILFYDERDQINFKGIFFNKKFELNIKKNDFIEIDLRMLLDYENIKESHITITEFKLYNDNDEQIYIATYNNGNHISYKNFVFINKHIFYNFEKDTKNLKIIIEFRMTKVEVIKIWYEPKNLDRFIIKHYGN